MCQIPVTLKAECYGCGFTSFYARNYSCTGLTYDFALSRAIDYLFGEIRQATPTLMTGVA